MHYVYVYPPNPLDKDLCLGGRSPKVHPLSSGHWSTTLIGRWVHHTYKHVALVCARFLRNHLKREKRAVFSGWISASGSRRSETTLLLTRFKGDRIRLKGDRSPTQEKRKEINPRPASFVAARFFNRRPAVKLQTVSTRKKAFHTPDVRVQRYKTKALNSLSLPNFASRADVNQNTRRPGVYKNSCHASGGQFTE